LPYSSNVLKLFLPVLHVYDNWDASDNKMMRTFVFWFVGIRQLRSVVIFTLDYYFIIVCLDISSISIVH